MAANQSEWPREWLMTDERMGERLWQAIGALPASGGIVFRHYSLPNDQRRDLGLSVAKAARSRELMLAVAGNSKLAEELGAVLVHNPDVPSALPVSLAVHGRQQAEQASRIGAALVFVAPVYPTRSHPGASGLGPETAAELARKAGCPAIALGGMDAASFRKLQQATSGSFHGYAGIDCWLRT